jgi:uncharacterized repeat protein (TIGR01451 family)
VDLGGTLTYSVTVTNISNVDAQNVIVTDTMPPYVTVISATPSQGSCTGTTCNLGTIGAGKAVSIAYVVTVDADADGDADAPELLTNMACVSTSTPESDLTNNCDTVDTHVHRPTPTPSPSPSPKTDLTIVKTDSPDPVNLGGILTYSVTVTNVSDVDAQNVVVTDTMPAHVTVISATPSQGSCTGTTCNLGTIAAGKAAVIAYVVTVDAGAPELLTNTACVSTSTPESDLTNNCDAVDTHVPQPAALAATATPKGLPTTGGLPGSGGASGRLVLGLGIGLLLAGAFAAAVARRRKDSTS